MPTEQEFTDAIGWALTQKWDSFGTMIDISKNTPAFLVHKVREHFNANNVVYEGFGFADLKRFLSERVATVLIRGYYGARQM